MREGMVECTTYPLWALRCADLCLGLMVMGWLLLVVGREKSWW